MSKTEDSQFVKIAIENYFIQKEQAIECIKVLKKMDEDGKSPLPPVAEVLVEKGYLTPIQRDVVYRMISSVEKTPQKPEKVASPPQPSPEKPFEKRTLAGCELLDPIGKGAMGTVYRAKQISMDRLVAVKVLSPKLSKDEDFRQRFLKEARATAKLNNNNIVAGIDVGEVNGEYYFVMEYVDGPSLFSLLERGGALEEKRALEIALQIAKALEHAQKHRMIHRDIKPDNILMTKSGVAKLCDLGLALQQSAGNVDAGKTVGTPNYVSPEQALGGKDIDTRSDIYSLGVTFFHMLTGRTPFEGTPAVVMTKHINEPAPSPLNFNPQLKNASVQIVAKMLEKAPDNRYQNPSELIEDLERVLEGGTPLVARQGTASGTPPKLKEISVPKARKTRIIRRPTRAPSRSNIRVPNSSPSIKATSSPASSSTLPAAASEENKSPKTPSSKTNVRRSIRKRRSRF